MSDTVAILLGWLVGLGATVAGLLIGLTVLKVLVRRKVPWWTSVAAPLLLLGPAVGLILGALILRRLDASAAMFWDESAPAGVKVAWSLLLFFAVTGIYGLVRAFLSSHLVATEMGIRIPEVFLDLGRFVTWIAMLFVVVGIIWHRTDLFDTLVAATGAFTLVLGLALQDTIKNFIAAWSILGEGTFKVGDWIWVGQDEGEVVSITRRTTKLRSRAGDIVTLPNGSVVGNVVRNQSRPTPAHAEVSLVQVSYDAPPNRVRDALKRAVLEVPKVLRDPAPALRVKRFADSGVEYEVKWWVTDLAGMHDIRSEVLAQIWYQFMRQGIEFPYPVVDLRPRARRLESPPEARTGAILARLRSVPFFQALPEDLLATVARDACFATYGAGEGVVHKGEPGDACYVVDQGRLAVVLSEAGVERHVAVLGPGEFFGEMSLLTGEPRSATVRALEDARLIAVGPSAVRLALERSPEIAEKLAELVALRREGLLEARAALDAQARARVDQQSKRLGELIKRFFRLSEGGAGAPPAGGGGGVAGRDPAP